MRKGSTAKFYVDSAGNYLGAYCGLQQLLGTYDDGEQVIIIERQDPIVPQGAIEVVSPPPHGFQKWDGVNNIWLPLVN